MRSKIQKWGNSLAVRIPKAYALDAQLEQDSEVEILLIDGQILIKPISPTRWSLDDLLAGVTKDNLHSETDTGTATGVETW
jgi:antitoxin MazE